ncbi:SseB family protein [Actinomadura latina]|uniref:SseB protein N-terminal domain-containing protein n=1 Tax=Actinomadura latina TaxID=163603 RepID=A0A846YWN8_9ACTN|nr:SseB family protein [Actinomadura latina]NKZ02908.1 hypothetical protein [Actinomadura latina]
MATVADAWRPTSELEHRLQETVRAGDQESYFRLLADSELVVPVPPELVDGVLANEAQPSWPTQEEDGRVHVLVYTSASAMRACLGPSYQHFMTVRFGDIAETWPDARWWLAIDAPAHGVGTVLPIEARMPAWFVRQVAEGDGRPPQVGRAPAPWEELRDQHRDLPRQSPRPEFQPANDVERELLRAASNNDHDLFLQTLADTDVLLPVPDDMDFTLRPGRPGFPWQTREVDGSTVVPVFTSPERLHEASAAGAEYIKLPFTVVLRYWPNHDWLLAINSGSPAGGTVLAQQLPGLATWADQRAAQRMTDNFEPQNDVEQRLLDLARRRDTDAFYKTLLGAQVLVPAETDTPWGIVPGDPDFPWRPVPVHGRTSIQVFTSLKWMNEAMGSSRFIMPSLHEMVAAWPDTDWTLVLNPGTPIDASMPGDQIRTLRGPATPPSASTPPPPETPAVPVAPAVPPAVPSAGTPGHAVPPTEPATGVPAGPKTPNIGTPGVPTGEGPADRPAETPHSPGPEPARHATPPQQGTSDISGGVAGQPGIHDTTSGAQPGQPTGSPQPGTPGDTGPSTMSGTPAGPGHPAGAPGFPHEGISGNASPSSTPGLSGSPEDPAGAPGSPHEGLSGGAGASGMPGGVDSSSTPGVGQGTSAYLGDGTHEALRASDDAVGLSGGRDAGQPGYQTGTPEQGSANGVIGTAGGHGAPNTAPHPELGHHAGAPGASSMSGAADSSGTPGAGQEPSTYLGDGTHDALRASGEAAGLGAAAPGSTGGRDAGEPGASPEGVTGGSPGGPGTHGAAPRPEGGHHAGTPHEGIAGASGGEAVSPYPGVPGGASPSGMGGDRDVVSGGAAGRHAGSPPEGALNGADAPDVAGGAGPSGAPGTESGVYSGEGAYGALGASDASGAAGPSGGRHAGAPREHGADASDVADGGHGVDAIGAPGTGPQLRAVGAVFEPGNRIDQELYEAAVGGDSDAFLRVLLNANVLVPIPAAAPLEVTPMQREFRWDAALRSETAVQVFTSLVRLREVLPESRFVYADFRELIGAWPRDDWTMLLNPGTRIGASLQGEQVRALSEWAVRVGLVRARPEVPLPPPRPEPVPAESPDDLDDRVSSLTIMQKVVPHGHVAWYLEQGYDRVGGFVHSTGDVAELQTPGQLYEALGLLYDGSPFSPSDEGVYVIRWPAYCPDLYRIPFGGRDEAELAAWGDAGWVVERAPFLGGGFAPGSAGSIREYKVDSVRLPYGAEMYYLGHDRSEQFVAMYDPDRLAWLRPEANGREAAQ